MSLSHKDLSDNKDSITASTPSRSTIDRDLPSEPNLSGGPSARTRSRTRSLNRSESINGDDGSSRPGSEVERGHHDTQAGSLAVNPSSTVSGPDDGQVLDPAIPSNPPSTLEERIGDVDSGPGTSSDTGPTVLESDVSGRQEIRDSPTAAATADSTTREAPPASHPPTAAATADSTTREAPPARHPPTAAAPVRPATPEAPAPVRPATPEAPRARHSLTVVMIERLTRREAPRARQATKRYCWAIFYFGLIFGLFVIAPTLSYAKGYNSASVSLQKLYVAIFQASVGATSAYCLRGYHATQQVYSRLPIILPIMGPAPRHSSGEELGAGLGDIYSNMSQALAAGNSLYSVPSLISKKRRQATRFRLPGWSLTVKPLGLFLQQSVHIDEFMTILLLSLGKTAGIALRQQQLTGDTLLEIQHVEYIPWIQPFRKCLFGTSAQESQLQTRLEQHLYHLNETITDSDQVLSKVLGEFTVLASTAETIRDSTIQDRERYLRMKEETASQRYWAFRASIHILGFSEPENLAKISQNIELADDIYEWAQDIVDVLHRATLHLQCAKTIVGSLIGTLNEFGTVTWSVADKDHKIQEFLALISEGQQLLTYNREAWYELNYAGLFT